MRVRRNARPGFSVVGAAIITIIVVGLLGWAVMYFLRLGQEGVKERLESDLKLYAFAQEEFASDNNRFAQSPEELTGFRFAEGTVVLRNEVQGAASWLITIGHEDSRWQCTLAGGVGTAVETPSPVCLNGEEAAEAGGEIATEDSLDPDM